MIARMLGQQVAAAWNGTVVIDNRTGAGGNIGTSLVATAAPDGYTLLLAGLHLVVNPSFYSNAGYGLEKDFAAVTNVAVSPMGIAVHPSLAARDMRELAALAKRSAVDAGLRAAGECSHGVCRLFAQRKRQVGARGAHDGFARRVAVIGVLIFMAFSEG